jgi:hypothetical protein
MLFTQATGISWDLPVLSDEFWFRAITDFAGRRIHRARNLSETPKRATKDRPPGALTAGVAELLPVVFVWFI